jgi:DNA-3-methyladenine glycosylase
MRKILKKDFFDRPVLTVTKDLIGKFLVRKCDGEETSSMITEAEAYDGLKDKASHASHGRTKKTEVMFWDGGHWFVYLTYGMHWMLNVVTGPKDYPTGILIRGVEAISGPGRVTKYFKIDKSLNGMMISKESGLWIEDRGVKIKASKIRHTKRVGVDYAGKYWAGRLFRFVMKD